MKVKKQYIKKLFDTPVGVQGDCNIVTGVLIDLDANVIVFNDKTYLNKEARETGKATLDQSNVRVSDITKNPNYANIFGIMLQLLLSTEKYSGATLEEYEVEEESPNLNTP